MKTKLFGVTACLTLLGIASLAQAALITIGTATYNASDYNLIWDDDNNGNSVIWMDYTNASTNYAAQNSWAAGLDGQLTYNIDAAYSVSWEDPAWRLGNTVDGPRGTNNYEGPDSDGDYNYSTGYNLYNSEMGHLFYEELENDGVRNTDGSVNPAPYFQNTGDFENLIAAAYWSRTMDTYEVNPVLDFAYTFGMENGGVWSVYVDDDVNHGYALKNGIALRSGQVSTDAPPVPEPATMLLFGTGLAGLAAFRRKIKN